MAPILETMKAWNIHCAGAPATALLLTTNITGLPR
jgi:hypothetical protein